MRESLIILFLFSFWSCKKILNDAIPPVITLVGDSIMLVKINDPYLEPGATAFDNRNGDLTKKIVVNGTVNTNIEGDYPVLYSVKDKAGNVSTRLRIVRVSISAFPFYDKTPPVITLIGSSNISINLGDVFIDEGAIASDDRDGDISSSITVTGIVDFQKCGIYNLEYNVSDAAGNNAVKVVRTVTVRSDKLSGVYSVNEIVTNSTVGDGTYIYNVTVNQAADNYNKLLISNFGAFAADVVYALVVGNQIVIPSQTVNISGQSGTSTLSGTGTYNGALGQITHINYSASNGMGDGDGSYTKQ
jgi:hypothetical protein